VIAVAACLALVIGGTSALVVSGADSADKTPVVSGGPAELSAAQKDAARAAYGGLPINFEANVGQTDGAVDFLARGNGYSLFLTASEAVMSLEKGPTEAEGPGAAGAVVRTQLLGSNPSATPVEQKQLPGVANYFVGDDPAQWRANVPTFGEVSYLGVYPGIDVKYHGTQGQLEYDFVVAPGADPGAIRFRVAGADGVSIAPEGDLVIAAPGGELRHHKPVVFQDLAGGRQPVDGSFVLLGNGEVGFQVGAYDTGATLVIDPVLAYSTYFGGTANDFGFGIAVDALGRAYLGGQTGSAVFPRGGGADFPAGGATPGAPQTTYAGGGSDGFILRVNAAGSALEYSTYLGGARADAGFDLAIDASNNAYLAGSTESSDDPGTTTIERAFPTTDGSNGSVAAYDTTCGTDGFCNNVLPTNFLVDACDPFEPACNPANPASPGFLPAICPAATNPTGCPTLGAQADNFVSKVNEAGNQLLYSTYFGGSGPEQNAEEVPYSGQMGVAVWNNLAYVHSMTYSSDFPTTFLAFQPNCASCADGTNDGYLMVLDTASPAGNSLRYSTYVGGSGFDEGKAVAVDDNGAAYLTGTITGVSSEPGSTTFPVKSSIAGTYVGSGPYDGSQYRGGYSDAYLTKVNPFTRSPSRSLVWSSFLGGGGKDEGWSVALFQGPGGPQPVVTGYTTSGPNPNPQIEDLAHPGACAGGPGPWCDWAPDPVPYFPLTAGAAQPTYAGRAETASGSGLYFDGDAFITKFFRDGEIQASTYHGGVNSDYGQSLALDVRGNVYVTGWSTCRNMDPPGPTTSPPQFEADGTPTGRNPGEPAQSGIPDCPVGYPTVNAPAGLDVMNTFNLGYESHNSPTGVFVAKLSADLSTVEYAVLIDSRGFDRGFSIAVRSERRSPRAGGDISEAYVTGRTGSAPDFPLTAGSYDTTYNGAGRDAFITKLVG
jgi:hypothetical protein